MMVARGSERARERCRENKYLFIGWDSRNARGHHRHVRRGVFRHDSPRRLHRKTQSVLGHLL